MKKNIAKPIAWSVVGTGILSLIVGTCVDWSGTPLIFASGSSSVQPLIQKLSNNFTNADVIANVGGSGMGINEIAHELKDIGMASKMPTVSKIGANSEIEERFNDYVQNYGWENVASNLYEKTANDSVNSFVQNEGEFTDLWGGLSSSKKSQTKTITIAWDAIAIVYSRQGLPDDVKLNINENNIADFYAAFSGYQKFNFIDVINKGLDEENQIDSDLNITMKPFARAGGANASGTADAFYNDSHLKPNTSEWTPEEQEKYNEYLEKSLEGGNYGPYVSTTNESNSQAWNTLLGGAENQRAGKIIYLSSGFVSQNLKSILDAGFDVALYNGHDIIKNRDTDNPVLDASEIAKNYEWYRPFNVMINIPNEGTPKSYLVDFINFLLRESQDGVDTENQPLYENDQTADGVNIFLEEGYAPLTKEQIFSMMLPNASGGYTDIWTISSDAEDKQKIFNDFLKEFYISDFQLLEQMDNNRFDSRVNDGVLYGANPHPVTNEKTNKN